VQVNPVTFRKHIAYVMQDDFVLATATPREALTFSARLRLPSSWTEEAIRKKVETLIKNLGIENCADTMIGGALIKGISGGERKRTCVGIEIVTEPSVRRNQSLFSSLFFILKFSFSSSSSFFSYYS
jgi:ATP-binding cassette subfamily G (WHITE) protein 2